MTRRMTVLTTDDLAAALMTERVGPSTFTASVPDGWQQGRGAFGGLVLGLLAKAMAQVEPDPERPLRTLSGEISSPVMPGASQLEVQLVRKGNGLTSLRAELLQQGEVVAHASAIFARTRAKDRDAGYIVPPSMRQWESVEVIPVEPPFGPDFARVFEFRPTAKLPFSGETEPGAEGWIRLKRRLSRFDGPTLVAHADAWWPVGFAVEPAPRPMATVAFTVQLFADPATLDPDVPLFHRARPLATSDGFAMELRELWTADGRLVAVNPQTFALIR